MEARSKEECGAGFLEHRGKLVRREIRRDAERTEHVGPAAARGDAAIAVLHHAQAGTGRNKHDRGRNVEQPEFVAARAADVDEGAEIRGNFKRFGHFQKGRR